jgi:ABC-type glutathione transport system ATPase component
VVLRAGEVVEHGRTAAVLSDPQHPYTRLLVDEHNLYGLDRFMRERPDRARSGAELERVG